MTHQGKVTVIEDAFLDKKGPGSGAVTPAMRHLTPAGTPAGGTPVASGAEDAKSGSSTPSRKKKLTRNQLKAKEERRKARKLHWLTFGGPKPDSDSDVELEDGRKV